MRILVVDDVPVNRTLLTGLLTRKQHMVETATNGQEAVTAVTKAAPPYDLVLMDIQMPVMDGCSATEAIRALPSPLGDTRVIAVTAHAMAGDRERYIGAGMNDYVSKPVRPGDLFAAIDRVAGNSRPALRPKQRHRQSRHHPHLNRRRRQTPSPPLPCWIRECWTSCTTVSTRKT